MKKHLIIIILLTLCIFLTGCGKTSSNEIVLNTNGGVPYVWEYEIEDASIINIDKVEDKELNPGTNGGVIEKHYYFKGMKKGTTTITFNYNDTRDNKIKETKKYKVIVDKNLNVKITENKRD